MIKIYTFASHRVDFIGLQLHSFRKHLNEEFEFIVFNNAKLSGDPSYDGINQQCRQNGISVIDIPRVPELVSRCQQLESTCAIFNPSGIYSIANVAHAYALCWAWENVISKEKCPIAMMDSDVFLIQSIKLTDTLYPHHLVNISDGREHPDGRVRYYMWPTFVMVDMARLPVPETMNWWCGKIDGVPVDVGGQTYHYFQAHPELDVFNLSRRHFSEDDPEVKIYPASYDEFYLTGGTVLHYRSGSNWNRKSDDYHQKKTEWLKRRIEEGQ